MAEEPMRFAILCVAWNEGDELRDWWRQVARLVEPGRVYIFDNATATAIDATAQSGARLLRSEKNIGYCAAMNRLLDQASRDGFDYAVAMNADVRLDERSLSHLLQTLVSAPDIALVHPKVLRRLAPDCLDGVFGEITWRHFAVRYHGEGERNDGAWDTPRDIPFGHGCCFALRIDAIRREGGYDESFFAYQDEAELGLRLAKAHRRVLYAPGAVVLHRGPNDKDGRAVKSYFLARNSVLLLRKHGGFAEGLKWVSWLLPAMLLRYGPRALGGCAESRAALMGWWDGWIGRRRLPEAERDGV